MPRENAAAHQIHVHPLALLGASLVEQSAVDATQQVHTREQVTQRLSLIDRIANLPEKRSHATCNELRAEISFNQTAAFWTLRSHLAVDK